MRIVSQDGTIDFQYENFAIARTGDNYIVAVRDTIARTDEIVKGVVAKYSTEVKAQRAMEMLREAYCGIVKVSKEITDMEVKHIAEDIGNGFYINPMPIQEPKVECKYFQFPADEELED